MTSKIAFVTEAWPNGPQHVSVVPEVDGTKLTDLVHAFEQDAGFEKEGEVSYAGLTPSFYKFGSAAAHYSEESRPGRDGLEQVGLLGCSCGEWGCWPLMARIVVTTQSVRWVDFEQPFRPRRDYSGFGPFVFRRADYDAAVAALAPLWDRRRDPPG